MSGYGSSHEVSGSMVGIGYGWVADERIPGQLVAAHYARLPPLWLLTRSEASHAERICFESGTSARLPNLRAQTARGLCPLLATCWG